MILRLLLKLYMKKLIDENISAKERNLYLILLLIKIEFDKSAQTLYLSYKYQM